jgi:hypothetical protein
MRKGKARRGERRGEGRGEGRGEMRKEERRVEFVRFRGGRWNHLQMTCHCSLLSRQEETQGEMLAVLGLGNVTVGVPCSVGFGECDSGCAMGTYQKRVQWCFFSAPRQVKRTVLTLAWEAHGFSQLPGKSSRQDHSLVDGKCLELQ